MSRLPRPRLLRRASGFVATAAVIGLLAACTVSPDSKRADTTPTPTVTADPVTPETIRTAPNTSVFAGGIAVEPNSLADRAEASLTSDGKEAQAAAAADIARRPVAMWIGDGYTDEQLSKEITDYLAAAEQQHKTAVFVTYAIPNRDCGDYSAGGLSADRYGAWNSKIVAELTGHRAVVMIEPDSLAMLSNCPAEADVRIPLIKAAVEQYSAAGIPAYLDAGNSHWVEPKLMAERLRAAGVEQARGFFTNVASFYPVDDERSYAGKISALTGGSHFVIDVSRNGQGWKGTWCNPDGVGLGQDPHVTGGGESKLDALLWIKTPGISDGTCNGGPAAGEWFPSFAQGLVERKAD
ncbi:glycoside hydrolase family 6 protein [Frigoribacterium sp. 2-23]|uniref:glycoside hydrolase family 6 protein n=1 Tax=Frigoribacterium sp. 2-23 TaxID=3415006 RepID=UPI003C6EC70E